MSECPNCHQHHHTHTTICPRCELRITQQLTQLALNHQTANNDPTLTPRGQPGHTTHATQPLPGGTNWLNHVHGHDTLTILEAWADDFANRYRLTPPHPTIPALTQWLRNNLPTATRDHPALTDLATELTRLVRTSRVYAGLTQAPHMRINCPQQLQDNTDCGRVLHIDTHTPHATTRCRDCGTEWDSLRLQLHALNTPGLEAWVDAEAAARFAQVSERTLRRWAKNGTVSRDNHGRYDVATLRDTPTTETA